MQVPSDKVPGLLPNPWCKRWGASLAEDAISTCAGCACYTRPPVTADKSYVNVDRSLDICVGDKPCYYNAYSLSRQQVVLAAARRSSFIPRWNNCQELTGGQWPNTRPGKSGVEFSLGLAAL